MRITPLFGLALGLSTSWLSAACGDECEPLDLPSGRFTIEEPASFSGSLDTNVGPIELQGGEIRLDRQAGTAVLTYPDERGQVTFRVTAWPPSPDGEGGSAGAR